MTFAVLAQMGAWPACVSSRIQNPVMCLNPNGGSMHNRRLKTLTVVATMLGAVSGAWAHETGMTGRSGKQVLNCGECHKVCSVKGPCTFPVTTFTGPTTMTAGETEAFTFVVTGGPGAFLNKGAGFNVAASSGTLASTDATIKTVGGELTHTAPHLFAGLKSVVFTFNYTAPDVAGDITLFGAGNSVDLSGTNAGDKWKTTTHVITVTGVPVTDSGHAVGFRHGARFRHQRGFRHERG